MEESGRVAKGSRDQGTKCLSLYPFVPLSLCPLWPSGEEGEGWTRRQVRGQRSKGRSQSGGGRRHFRLKIANSKSQNGGGEWSSGGRRGFEESRSRGIEAGSFQIEDCRCQIAKCPDCWRSWRSWRLFASAPRLLSAAPKLAGQPGRSIICRKLIGHVSQ